MQRQRTMATAAMAAGLAGSTLLAGGSPTWSSVANNGQLMPGSTKFFNSYNQPSVNADGLVVFRARSKGPSQPVRGIYAVHLAEPGRPIRTVAAVGQEVPAPNNTETPPGSGELAGFLEFPSFPRIDIGSGMIATRAQTKPTWTTTLPDGSETRVGTAGIYTTGGSELVSAVTLLGAVRDAATGSLVFPWWQVPGTAEGTRFDQFPGAASAADGEYAVFKGNWTETATGAGRTGVYCRSTAAKGGMAPVFRIADSTMLIPGQGAGGTVPFGSTAPPSAAYGSAVFLGVDFEEAPTMGGIYLAALEPDPALLEVVSLGDPVPGEAPGTGFARIGEALSFDGRWVAFWASWGSEVTAKTLTCPDDGNAELLEFCRDRHPDGHVVEVPLHQGFFAADTWSGTVHAIAKTGGGIDDFVYWNFSGSPPDAGSEGSDQEEPRWRSASFVAIAGMGTDTFQASFKGRVAGNDLIFAANGPGGVPGVLVGTMTPGTEVDAQAPAGSVVTAVGIERDALRGGNLVMTASMLDAVTGESWAGVYATTPGAGALCAADLDGDGFVGGSDLGLLLAAWGCAGPCPADVDRDGSVGGTDLGLLLAAWGPCN